LEITSAAQLFFRLTWIKTSPGRPKTKSLKPTDDNAPGRALIFVHALLGETQVFARAPVLSSLLAGAMDLGTRRLFNEKRSA